mmetsp:Transcript_6600/g.8956  ORF Transcript_6600/g.8956 Transcript_6600/m.8956 type:complete len:110 (-) Transcript_6600:123-452(-)
MKDRKRYSLQDEDAEPRYEISKLSRMAKIDLDETNRENLNEQERLYGDGKNIGDDIIQQNRSSSQADVHPEKQLEGKLGQYLKFRNNDREATMTPLQEGIKQFNSGHLI